MKIMENLKLYGSNNSASKHSDIKIKNKQKFQVVAYLNVSIGLVLRGKEREKEKHNVCM